MKLKVLVLALSLFCVTSVLKAQDYHTAIGARVGYFNGLTIKHFISGNNAIEGIASFRWRGFVLTGLYEWQKPVKGLRNLDYYIGLGGHVGFWDNKHYYWYDNDRGPGNFTVLGVDFIAGLEYNFTEVPFNVGLDWKPAFNLIGDSHWWGYGIALSIRYAF